MTNQAAALFNRHFEEKYIFGSLSYLFFKELPRDKEIVFLCIGVDRSLGDCFGPMTGTLLQQLGVSHIYGTLDNPVHAKNLSAIYAGIQKEKFIVAIDASLGSAGEIGYVKVKRSPILPGSAMGKELPSVGDLSVILVVNIAGIANHLLLQNSSMKIVWKGANLVAKSIFTAICKIKKAR